MRVQGRCLQLIAGCGLLIGQAAMAQSASKAGAELPGASWESITKLPDFVDVWEVTFGRGTRQQSFSFTPEYQARQKAFETAGIEDSPMANCVPPGMPGIMTQPYPIEILFTPGKVTILIEALMQMRHIYTDGRALPEDPDPTFNGHSIGHWDGDTLVVESVGFTPQTRLGFVPIPLGGDEGMHSDKMRITERIRLADANTLEIQTTVEDPEALTKPWGGSASYARHSDWTLTEYVCQENNRNFVNDAGKAGINLER